MQLNSTTVALVSQLSYQQPLLDQTVDHLLSMIDDLGTLRTARILLKPNLITARNGSLPCTEGRFITAVARWFLEQGAQVAIGDSPAFGSARAVLDAIGALSTLQSLGVPVVEFSRTQPIILPCGQPAAMAAAAMECDLLVNLPRVKAHSQMRVTLAVKNYFGCLSGFHKPWWHMAHGGNNGRFAALLLDLLAVLPPSLSLVDGIVGMHQTGPIHGEPFSLGVMSCGVNPVAIDTALLVLLGIDSSQSPLWRAACQAGIQGTVLEDLVFPLAAPVGLRVQGFVVPDELGPVRFNPFRFVRNSLKRLLLRVEVPGSK
jgi:uncharacterized protein (DUF362 family)